MLSMIENERKICDQMTLERLLRQYLSSSEGIHNESTSSDQLPIIALKPAFRVNDSISSDVLAGRPISSHHINNQVERSNSARALSSSSLTSQIATSPPRHNLMSGPVEAGIPFVGHRSLQRTASDPISILNQPAFPLSSERSSVSESLSGEVGTLSCRYKTELCRSFEEHGTCKYGDKCQFAHGRNELRVVSRHPKYKTDLCKTYHTTGLCPYGSRCHFIHKSDEDSIANQRVIEDKMKVLKEQELLLLQQRQQRQQQQQQQELLVTAMMQASRQRHLSQLSATTTSPAKRSSLSAPSQRSAFSTSSSLCDSFDSLVNSSLSSSESDSPRPSPSHSMFGSDELNGSAESINESLPSQTSNFNWPNSIQTSLFNAFSLSNNESNFSLPITQTSDALAYRKLNLPTDYQESQAFAWPQNETPLSHAYDSTHLTSSLISRLAALSIDTSMLDNILLAKLVKAVASTKGSQQNTANNVSQWNTPMDFNDRFQNMQTFLH
jgi:butyrate response factor 1